MNSEKKIVLAGGLGNQLFQLCAGLYLEKKFKSEIHYDVSNLTARKNNKNRSFTRNLEILELLPVDRIHRLPIRFHNLLTKIRKISKNKKVFFEDNRINAGIEGIAPNTSVVYGFFQNAELAELMWTDLRYLMENSKSFSPIFSAPVHDRIAIHLRFGDYKENSVTKTKHGLTEISYYLEAVRILKEKDKDLKNLLIVTDNYSDAQVFVGNSFSDFNVAFQTGLDPVSDLLEIASSKNIVISNSTFSWWGAFLASKLRKTGVIYPRPWMADESDPDLPLYVDEWQALKRNFQIM